MILPLLLLLSIPVQAGAAAVSADQTAGGAKPSNPPASTAPSGPHPMDTDQTILNSALGTSGAANSDSAPEGSRDPGFAEPDQATHQPASDSVITEATGAAQSLAQGDMTQGSMKDESAQPGTPRANDSAATQQGSQHEEEVAQLGFAVQFMVQGLRNGAGPTLMPLLVRLLPFLLKTQVFCRTTQMSLHPCCQHHLGSALLLMADAALECKGHAQPLQHMHAV